MKLLIIIYTVFLSGCSVLIFNPYVETELHQKNIALHVESLSVEKSLKTNTKLSFSLKNKELEEKSIVGIKNQITWLTKNESLDSATLHLINYLYALNNNTDVNNLYQNNKKNTVLANSKYKEFYFLFIPGWLYQTMPETGSDFKRIRSVLTKQGFDNELLLIQENGLLKENTKLIKKRITELKDKKLIIITVSKSAPEFAALVSDEYLRTNPQLKGWINISGLLKGTPLADLASQFPLNISSELLFGVNNLNTDTVLELRHNQQKVYFKDYNENESFKILNIVGIPFFDQVSSLGWLGYQFLYKNGPNDGRALILDELAPGNTLIEIGLDHYYLDPNMDIKTLAILKTMVDILP